MTIEKIYFENYKAFKTGQVDLKPISVLLGANSSGKSSIIKLLLLLSQTVTSKSRNQLQTEGKLVDLGEIDNLFWNRDIKKVLKLQFTVGEGDIDLNQFSLTTQFMQMCHRVLRNDVNELERFYEIGEMKPTTLEHEIRRVTRLARLSRENRCIETAFEAIDLYIKTISRVRRKIPKVTKVPTSNSHFDLFGLEVEFDSNEKVSKVWLSDIFKFIKDISKLGRVHSFGYDFRVYKGQLQIDNAYFLCDKGKTQISFWNQKTNRKQIKLFSSVLDLKYFDKYKKTFNSNIDFFNLNFRWIGENRTNLSRNQARFQEAGVIFPLFSVLVKIFNHQINMLGNHKVKHVSPLRFYPKRYFLVESGTDETFWDTVSGEKLSSILKDNPKVKSQMNAWFKKFDLEIDIEKLQGMIHSIKVKDNGFPLDITDVGFGVSQILPVILQPYLSSDSGIIIIEQPEIHIHPKMQSELADFFISLAITSDKRFLIETHSEAFLKRLRRRIAESTEQLEKSISHKHVSIQFVEKRLDKKHSAIVKNVEVEKSGFFEWPEDFQVNDIEDTIEFMKYQGRV